MACSVGDGTLVFDQGCNFSKGFFFLDHVNNKVSVIPVSLYLLISLTLIEDRKW